MRTRLLPPTPAPTTTAPTAPTTAPTTTAPSTTPQSSASLAWDRLTSVPLPETAGANAVEFFSIAGAGDGGSEGSNNNNNKNYLAVANTRDAGDGRTNRNSFVFELAPANDGVFAADPSFTVVATVPTLGAVDWEHFRVGGADYLAVANNVDSRSGSGDIDSVVYRWNEIVTCPLSHMHAFRPNAGFDKCCASTLSRGLAPFKTYGAARPSTCKDDDFVACSAPPCQDFGTEQLSEHQRLPTRNAEDIEHYRIDGDGGGDFLAVCNFAGDTVVYRWNATTTAVVEHQRLATKGAKDADHFELGGAHFLAVANHYDAAAESFEVDSPLFKWSAAAQRFEEYQAFATHGAHDWEHFHVAGDGPDGGDFLVVANFGSTGTTTNVDSVLYKWTASAEDWQAKPTFVEFARFPTKGARDWTVFFEAAEDGGGEQLPRLVVANSWDSDAGTADTASVLYAGSFAHDRVAGGNLEVASEVLIQGTGVLAALRELEEKVARLEEQAAE